MAEVFDVTHDEILRRIKNCQCSEEFRLRNFAESSYLNSQNREMPMYEMTRDGFSFLVMGFTGAKAAQFKEAYIEAFNKMEDQIKIQIDANDKMLITQDRYFQEMMSLHHGQMEIQRGNQELLQVISSGVFKIGEQVEKVTERVSNLETKFTDLQNVIPIPRSRVSKKVRGIHSSFIYHKYAGRCPICGEQIIGADKNPKNIFQIDHQFNRQEASLDKTWGLCGNCNRSKSNGNLSQSKCQIYFDYYQENLNDWVKQEAKQRQLFG